jgi:hypothetical protein
VVGKGYGRQAPHPVAIGMFKALFKRAGVDLPFSDPGDLVFKQGNVVVMEKLRKGQTLQFRLRASRE